MNARNVSVDAVIDVRFKLPTEVAKLVPVVPRGFVAVLTIGPIKVFRS